MELVDRKARAILCEKELEGGGVEEEERGGTSLKLGGESRTVEGEEFQGWFASRGCVVHLENTNPCQTFSLPSSLAELIYLEHSPADALG